MSDATASREQRKKMKSFRTKVAQVTGSVIAASAIAIVGLTGLAQPAQAAGGVNVDQHCRTTYAGASPSAVLVSNDAYGWRCKIRATNGMWQQVGANIGHACIQQHGNSSRAYLLNGNASSPYNWRCT